MFTTNRTSHTLVACSQYIMLRLFPTDSVVRLTGPGQDWHTNAKGKYIPKGRFFRFVFQYLIEIQTHTAHQIYKKMRLCGMNVRYHIGKCL